MDHRKHGLHVQESSTASSTARRRSELGQLNREQREALLRSKRTRIESASASEVSCITLGEAVASLDGALEDSPAAVLRAVRQLRQYVSGLSYPSLDALRGRVVPLLVRVLLMRQGGDEARAAALEASWAVTNLAALEHDVVEAIAPTAPLLVAYLNRASGYAVAEQCAWALGNMAGDCSLLAATVAASGAILPLARLLLCAAAVCPCKQLVSAAHTAAWALSNILWGLPSQAGPLLNVPGFRDGLVAILKRNHDTHLQQEAAWLLAFLCAGPETHMHAMVKHGAAEAVVASFVTAVQEAERSEVWPSAALLVPLLRCMGNMASSTAAAVPLTSRECVAATARCTRMEKFGVQGEALWVLKNVDAVARG